MANLVPYVRKSDKDTRRCPRMSHIKEFMATVKSTGARCRIHLPMGVDIPHKSSTRLVVHAESSSGNNKKNSSSSKKKDKDKHRNSKKSGSNNTNSNNSNSNNQKNRKSSTGILQYTDETKDSIDFWKTLAVARKEADRKHRRRKKKEERLHRKAVLDAKKMLDRVEQEANSSSNNQNHIHIHNHASIIHGNGRHTPPQGSPLPPVTATTVQQQPLYPSKQSVPAIGTPASGSEPSVASITEMSITTDDESSSWCSSSEGRHFLIPPSLLDPANGALSPRNCSSSWDSESEPSWVALISDHHGKPGQNHSHGRYSHRHRDGRNLWTGSHGEGGGYDDESSTLALSHIAGTDDSVFEDDAASHCSAHSQDADKEQQSLYLPSPSPVKPQSVPSDLLGRGINYDGNQQDIDHNAVGHDVDSKQPFRVDSSPVGISQRSPSNHEPRGHILPSNLYLSSTFS